MNVYKIGEMIKKRRKELGLTGDRLAEKAGVSDKSLISNWENGKAIPKLEHFVSVAKALDCDPEYLLGTMAEATREKTDVAEALSLDSDAIEILLDLKPDCEDSQEAQFISDLISFFIKALYSDICGEDSVSLIRALNGMCDYRNNSIFHGSEENERITQVYRL